MTSAQLTLLQQHEDCTRKKLKKVPIPHHDVSTLTIPGIDIGRTIMLGDSLEGEKYVTERKRHVSPLNGIFSTT